MNDVERGQLMESIKLGRRLLGTGIYIKTQDTFELSRAVLQKVYNALDAAERLLTKEETP